MLKIALFFETYNASAFSAGNSFRTQTKMNAPDVFSVFALNHNDDIWRWGRLTPIVRADRKRRTEQVILRKDEQIEGRVTSDERHETCVEMQRPQM